MDIPKIAALINSEFGITDCTEKLKLLIKDFVDKAIISSVV